MKPKYRLLDLSELTSLEKEFIEFLVLNGITADVWLKIKKEEPAKAEHFTVLFSDVVFEEILRKNQYLIFVSSGLVHCFQCLQESVILLGLEANNENVDLSSLNFDPANLKNCKIFYTEKAYLQPRELEMFQLISQGCELSDGALFKKMAILYAASQSAE